MSKPEPNVFEIEHRQDGWYVTRNGNAIGTSFGSGVGGEVRAMAARDRAEQWDREHREQAA